ncbi:MAG: glycosyltransferase [Proteobacteria bacterium]|nr:glycosyltransferase [Pseudomonadota bacterium]
MRLLFVHKQFPGQFLNLALAFVAQPGNEVVFISTEPGFAVQGIRTVQIQPARTSTAPTHHYVQPLENAVLLGQAAYRAAANLRQEGFVPDLIYAQAGSGLGLFIRDVFPETPIIGHFEWYYHPDNSNSDFLSSEEITEDEGLRLRTKNAGQLLELAQCDYGICPTEFQMDQFPPEFHGKLQVIHEGIDTSFFSPSMRGQLTIGDLHLGDDVEIVTYATHGLEPYRGFPQFMRALGTLQSLRPRLHAVITGNDAVYYGNPRADGKTWKEAMLEELPALDLSRLHFTGPLPIQDYRRVLRASHAHVYLTVPFVLSWSLLEAMSTGCTIVGSATAPVCDVIEDGETGLLADFFDPFRLAARIGEALDDRDLAVALGQAARTYTVDHYDLGAVLPSHFRLASHVLGRDVTKQQLAEITAKSA